MGRENVKQIIRETMTVKLTQRRADVERGMYSLHTHVHTHARTHARTHTNIVTSIQLKRTTNRHLMRRKTAVWIRKHGRHIGYGTKTS